MDKNYIWYKGIIRAQKNVRQVCHWLLDIRKKATEI